MHVTAHKWFEGLLLSYYSACCECVLTIVHKHMLNTYNICMWSSIQLPFFFFSKKCTFSKVFIVLVCGSHNFYISVYQNSHLLWHHSTFKTAFKLHKLWHSFFFFTQLLSDSWNYSYWEFQELFFLMKLNTSYTLY